MTVNNIIVIGGGAGGTNPLNTVLAALPKGLDAAVFVVLHMPGQSPNGLLDTLQKTSCLPVSVPADGDKIESGHVYLAALNRHLLVKEGTICVSSGPKENRVRPAIDALFRTAAHSYDHHVIGIVLSGVLNDGTAGLMSVKRHGGICIVQTAETAVFAGMPDSAALFTDIDHRVSAHQIAPIVMAHISQLSSRSERVMSEPIHRKADVAEIGGPGLSHISQATAPSAFTCPACGGAVWEVQEQALTLFKCHVGHSYTAELMLEEQSEAVNDAAWVLLRILEENITLRRRLASWARLTDRAEEAEYHELHALESDRRSESLKAMILSGGGG